MTTEYRFASNSTPGVSYVVQETDGYLSCNCRGWVFSKKVPRACRHTVAVAAQRAATPAPAAEPALSFDPPAAPPTETPAGRAGYVQPMLATPQEGRALDAFTTDDWWLEEKFDGHRVIVAVREGGDVACWSRPGAGKKDGLPRTLPAHLLEVLAQFLPGTYDGELVAPTGASSDVSRLDAQAQLSLVLFDVLAIGTLDLTADTNAGRRCYLEVVAAGLRACGVTSVRVSEMQPVSAAAVAAIWARGGEGAILKRADGRYLPGKRTPDWVKVKRLESATLTIVGFEAGKSGPYAVAQLQSPQIQTTVAVKDMATMRAVEANPAAFIGRQLRIEHQGLFAGPKGVKPRHASWDHLVEEVA